MSLTPDTSIFRHRPYTHYWVMLVLMAGARTMEFVVIGSQVYLLALELTGSEKQAVFVLGLVGLVQFIPVFLLSLVGGQAADRLSQRAILMACQSARGVVSLALLASVFMPADLALPVIFVCAAMLGVVNAFSPAASSALYPRLVPRAELPMAVSWNSLGRQTASVTFPALGGLIYAIGAEYVFGLAAIMCAVATVAIATAGTPRHEKTHDAAGLDMVIAGLRYVGRNKIVLGAISLDLVVVFFGSVIALLPVFAFDILNVGKIGLGFLHSAFAIGAVCVAYVLASSPLRRNVGRWMFGSVAVFGVCIFIFALSKVFWLSMAVLIIAGGADMISMYIRSSLIQLATPDEMKGRVSSVSFIFISASNELGNFESGVAARFLGPVGASMFGGAVAVGSAALWWKLFPALAAADTFEDIEELAVDAA